MSKLEAFLSDADEREIVAAIRMAEKHTSGEIRVHIEYSTKTETIEERVLELFHILKMDNTKLQNGVLLYVAINDKQFAIYGDKGINEVVENDFWDSTKDIIKGHFKKGNFKEGLISGILSAGKKLEHYFPWDESDTDELSNEISKG